MLNASPADGGLHGGPGPARSAVCAGHRRQSPKLRAQSQPGSLVPQGACGCMCVFANACMCAAHVHMCIQFCHNIKLCDNDSRLWPKFGCTNHLIIFLLGRCVVEVGIRYKVCQSYEVIVQSPCHHLLVVRLGAGRRAVRGRSVLQRHATSTEHILRFSLIIVSNAGWHAMPVCGVLGNVICSHNLMVPFTLSVLLHIGMHRWTGVY